MNLVDSEQRICRVCGEKAKPDSVVTEKKIFSNVREFSREKFTVWRCSACNSLNSLEAVKLERYYEKYHVRNASLNYFTKCAYINALKLLATHGLTKSSRILDFGCSEGLFCDFLRSKGYEYVRGYDRFSDRFNCTSAFNDAYDFVVSYDVIEHFETPHEFAEQVAPLVKPGGVLVIGTPNADTTEFSEPDPVFEFHQPYHRFLISEDAMIKLMSRYSLNHLASYHRAYSDTPYPGVNMRFLRSYVHKAGGVVDVLYEPYQFKVLSPRLVWEALFGYFAPSPGFMTVVFQSHS